MNLTVWRNEINHNFAVAVVSIEEKERTVVRWIDFIRKTRGETVKHGNYFKSFWRIRQRTFWCQEWRSNSLPLQIAQHRRRVSKTSLRFDLNLRRRPRNTASQEDTKFEIVSVPLHSPTRFSLTRMIWRCVAICKRSSFASSSSLWVLVSIWTVRSLQLHARKEQNDHFNNRFT